MKAARSGECPNCPHDIIDARDLKFFRNVCGYSFEPEQDRFRWRGNLRLARIGLAELLVFAGLFLSIAAGIAIAAWVTQFAWLWAIAIVPFVLAVFVVSFFRDPVRDIPQGAGVIVSPADGTVDDIEHLDHCDFLEGPATKVGIFLSVFNVHVNRSPESSRVIELRYLPGAFGNAMRKELMAGNEQLWIAVQGIEPPFRRMLIKQIAGLIARRIVCELRPGEIVSRGQKIGMIKFGSRTELFLPRDDRLRIEVKMNQSVRGGSTILARYAELGSSS